MQDTLVERVNMTNCSKLIYNGHTFFGWQTSRGLKNRISVDKIGEFLWTLLVNSRGHLFHENTSF